MRHAPTLAVSLVATLALAGPAAAGTYKNELLGFKISIPSEYTEVPPRPTEPYIVARFLSDERQFVTDSGFGYTIEHFPGIRIIAFLDTIVEDEEDVLDDNVFSGEASIEWSPFPDYLEFMKGRYSNFFQLEDPEYDEVNDVPVEKLLLSYQDDRMRLLTWIYETEVGKIAIQVDTLTDDLDDMEREALKIFRSFKPIDREGDLREFVKRNQIVTFYLDNLTAEDRRIRREEMEAEAWRRSQIGLPDDWDAMYVDDVPVLTHAGKSHAKKVASHVLAVRSWLSETFPDLGPDEYVRMPVLRICESYPEERFYLEGIPDYFRTINEIVTHKSNSGAASSEWRHVNRETARAWFDDKNSSVRTVMPPWLRLGLIELIAYASPKRGTLEFDEGFLERFLKREIDEDNLTPCRELMTMPEHEFYANNEVRFDRLGESVALVRYFLTGAGSKAEETETFFADYVSNLVDVLDEIDAEEEEKNKDRPEPKNREEEEQRQRERQERAKENRSRVLEEAAKRTFGGWTASQWEDLDRDYEKSL